MSLFGAGRSEERRRRLLTEEVVNGGSRTETKSTEPATRSGAGEARTNRNREAARMERQTRITDLIPKSYGLLGLAFFVGALMIAGVEALYFYMPKLAEHTTDGRIAAFDLDGEGSLAVWFSSLLLTLAAATALVVYSVRKHRADDYHARYRIWFAAAFCWFVLSIDESASLHEGFKEWMTHITGERGYGDGSVWWVGAYTAVLGLVGLRLALDMKECRLSTFLFGLTAVCYVAAVVVQLNLVLPDSGAQGVMLEEGLEMGGDLLLLLAMLTHARYVILESQGDITPRAAKQKKDKGEKTKATAAAAEAPAKSGFGWFRKAKIDPPHGTPSPAGKTTDLEPVTKSPRASSSRATTETLDVAAQNARGSVKKVQASFDDEEDEEGRDNRKLSKSDRKALRRQKEFERRYGQE